uniref:Uncharacterized protein n=1 Tax=Salix viminalis TaxID=40686 RepID=A0A6N2MMY9_SALVM
MELIDQLEVTRRGPYSGGFGGISFSGDMDIALLVLMQVFIQENVRAKPQLGRCHFDLAEAAFLKE